jgi:hypothetical protein
MPSFIQPRKEASANYEKNSSMGEKQELPTPLHPNSSFAFFPSSCRLILWHFVHDIADAHLKNRATMLILSLAPLAAVDLHTEIVNSSLSLPYSLFRTANE